MTTGKGRRWLVGLGLAGTVAVLVLVGAVVMGRGGSAIPTTASQGEGRTVAVTVEPVTARPIRRTVTVVGSLYGRDEVSLTPKVEGRVVKIYHDVGDVVKPGEPLLDIDPIDYQLAVAEARRGLELELARLGLKDLPSGPYEVTTLPAVNRAALLEKNASARLERMRVLGRTGAATVEDLDQSRTDHAVAQANYQQAILDAEATLAAARHRQAALESALQKLRDARVVAPSPSPLIAQETTAPVEYVVCQRLVSEGEIVRMLPGSSNNLFKLIIDRPLKLQAIIPERHKAEIKLGQEAELEVEAFPGEKFLGKVARINPAVERTSRTFMAEILVPNADRRLSPGSFARVAILTHIDPQARTVPEEALVSFAGVTKLFVVREGVAHEVKVRLGAALDVPGAERPRTWIEVSEEDRESTKPRKNANTPQAEKASTSQPLPTGALVITSGQSQLADGTPVRVREPGR